MFSNEIWEIFRNNFFYRTPSILLPHIVKQLRKPAPMVYVFHHTRGCVLVLQLYATYDCFSE